jgi:hypothetical protein
VTPVIFGTLGANGWYTTNVTVNWSVSDPESVILATSGCDATTLTSDTAGVKLTCSATSDGGETVVSKTIKIDKTAPSVTGTRDRAADSNGWYNHAVSIAFTATDGMSGVDSCVGPKTYSGPDDAAASVVGTCSDKAGNVGVASVGLKYDATSPSVTGSSAGRAPDSSGWYNHAVDISFAGSDAVSGIDSCTQATYSGPDTATASVAGTCRDKAGNTSGSATFALKYDGTGPSVTATPSRTADANGWYNHALTVSFSGADATSGRDSCVAPQTYSGPDDAAAAVTGSCRDVAGNSTPKAFALKYDATAPTLTASAGRAPDANGWYNHPLTVSFAASDGTAGVDTATCPAPQTYSGPDNATASLTGACLDNAGNLGTASLSLKYDATGPAVTATPSRGPDANGWYDRPMSVGFSGSDVTSGLDSCVPDKGYSGPDDANASVTGSCRDKAGNTTPRTFQLKYDATAPQVAANPARSPDANGWYDHALSVGFTGTDGTSGLASCTAAKTYSGPDDPAASVPGSCSDVAGNVGVTSFALKYDATAPQMTGASPARVPDANGWYNHPVTVGFTGSDVTSGVASCADRTYSGPDNGSASVNGTCVDKAGNESAPSAFGLKYDASGPSVAATPARPPDANGWYDRPLTVSFSGSDAFSGVASCVTPQSYAGPDSATASVGGSCSDKAGNVGTASFGLKYDATAPAVTAGASRAADANGWYNHAVDVSFRGDDASSGVASCTGPVTYKGPDSGSVSVSGSCADKAGNVGAASLPLRYDATGPSVAATPSRAPDSNGWYNHALSVAFSGADATSGTASCAAAKTYAGPDDKAASVAGSCSDVAGNTAVGTLAVKYDASAPQVTGAVPGRAADANGWYNHPLAIEFTGADSTSGVDACTRVTYAGPDASSASVNGLCTDFAGNASGVGAYGLKYDATAPHVTTPVPMRPSDRNGWYNHPISFAFEGSDVTSGIDACSPTTYAGPDSADAVATGACIDQAGNTGTGSFALKYDATGPGVSATPARRPDHGSWYNRGLTVGFTGADGVSGIESCAPPKTYAGPDRASASVGGTCSDLAGNVGFGAVAFDYDATAPHVSGASPDRPPDANGWYNRPLSVEFHGTDETSLVDSCTAARYAGPDSRAAVVTGSCRDHAGNESASLDFGVRYDSSAPKLAGVHVEAGDRRVVLGWQPSSDVTRSEVTRFGGSNGSGVVVYAGAGDSYTDRRVKNGVRYRYVVRVFDQAENAASDTVVALPRPVLFQPAPGAKVTSPPLLAWEPAANTRYYNVQVWRHGKIFSAWPSTSRLRLKRSWTYQGRRYTLTPGRYRWYVWPGRGRRSAKRYGSLLGGSSFVVVAPRRRAG